MQLVHHQRNPHGLSAAYRVAHHKLMSQYIDVSYTIKDLYGSARTPDLFPLHAVHVHRPTVTMKDLEREMLVSRKLGYKNKVKFDKTTKKTKMLTPVPKHPTWCTHNIEKCYCSVQKNNKTVHFLNDVYQEDVSTTIANFGNTINNQTIFAIFKVFSPKYAGGNIICFNHSKNTDEYQGLVS